MTAPQLNDFLCLIAWFSELIPMNSKLSNQTIKVGVSFGPNPPIWIRLVQVCNVVLYWLIGEWNVPIINRASRRHFSWRNFQNPPHDILKFSRCFPTVELHTTSAHQYIFQFFSGNLLIRRFSLWLAKKTRTWKEGRFQSSNQANSPLMKGRTIDLFTTSTWLISLIRHDSSAYNECDSWGALIDRLGIKFWWFKKVFLFPPPDIFGWAGKWWISELLSDTRGYRVGLNLSAIANIQVHWSAGGRSWYSRSLEILIQYEKSRSLTHFLFSAFQNLAVNQ